MSKEVISKQEQRKNNIADVKRWYIGRVQTEKEKRGEEAELAFETKTLDLISNNRLWWARGLSRAPSSEDILERIDFKIRAFMKNQDNTLTEFSILIQIKSPYSDDFGKNFEIVRKNGGIIRIVALDKYARPEGLQRVLCSIYWKEVELRKQTQQPA